MDLIIPGFTPITSVGFRKFGVVQADAYIGRIAAVFDVLAMHDIGTHRAELGDNISSLPVEQHMIYFVSSHSVITVIRILSQSQDTARHEPWR
ncbi:type II toxin-antitoxin system RelE/ParE family toxin [Enterobacter cloacae]